MNIIKKRVATTLNFNFNPEEEELLKKTYDLLEQMKENHIIVTDINLEELRRGLDQSLELLGLLSGEKDHSYPKALS